jgi:hypothetical protein
MSAGFWRAQVESSSSLSGDGIYHVNVWVFGDTHEAARDGAETVTRLLTTERRTFMRCSPEAVSETDFDTKENIHRGYAWFSMTEEPGETVPVEATVSVPLGNAVA